MGEKKLLLTDYIGKVYENLQNLNYKHSSLKVFKQSCKKLRKYADDNGIAEFSLKLKDDFLLNTIDYPAKSKKELPVVDYHTVLAMQKLTDYFIHSAVTKIRTSQNYVFDDCFSEIIALFQASLENRQYSNGTIKRTKICLQRFCNYIKSKKVDNFSELSKQEISSYTKTLFGLAQKTITLELYRLRLFCKFLYLEGFHKEDIEKVLSSIDRGNPCGKRDYAILLLVTRLGLRNSDVSNLSIKYHKPRISIMQLFARFMIAKGLNAYVIPKDCSEKSISRFVPYIFTIDELKRFFIACDNIEPNPNSPNRYLVMPLLFRVLYGCGLRVSETTSLKIKDIDFENCVLTIREAKFGNERFIPMTKQLTEKCLDFYSKVHLFSNLDSYFFPAPYGRMYSTKSVYDNFRHTFSVHSLKKWVMQGQDI